MFTHLQGFRGIGVFSALTQLIEVIPKERYRSR